MRRLILGIAIGAVGLFGTVTAQAGALTGATFSLSVGTLGPLTFVGGGTAAGSAIHTQSVTVAAGNAFNGMMTTTLTPKQAPPLSKIVVIITKNDAIKATATKVGDPLEGVAGAVRGIANQIAFMNTLLSVPVAAGVSGTSTIKGSVFNIKAVSKKWTSGMTTVTGLDGGATFMATGSLMAGTPGAVTLVAVSKVTVTGAANIITYTLATLEMDFVKVPEPTMPLMMVAGAATLALVGGRKLRKS